MRGSTFVSASLSLLLGLAAREATAATVLDYSKVPTCAKKCTVLTTANTGCVSTQSDQGAYQSCFCQAPTLTPLYSGPGLCSSVCSSTDDAAIQQWYRSLCTGGVVVTPGASSGQASQTSSAGAASSTSTAGSQTSSQSSSATSGSSSASSGSANSSDSNKSWISTHYGWLIFVIVVFLAIIAGFWGGFFLRRRHKRQQAANRYSSNSHLPGPGSRASPFDSGVLSGADGAFIGSRNHPQMTMVADAGSEAAFERYEGYKGGAAESTRHAAPSPPPGARNARAKLGRGR